MDITSKEGKPYSLRVPDQKEVQDSCFVGNFNIFPILSFLRNPRFLLPASLSGQQYYTQRQNPAESVFYLCTHTMCIIPLFSVDSSGGPAASSVFHVHGFSKGLGCSKLAVSQSNHNSTMTKSSFLLCGASPQERFGDHNVLI